MKKNLLLFSFLFIIELIFAGTPVASIVFSVPVVPSSLTHYTTTSTSSESYTVQTSKAGIACRQTPISKYGYFNVNDATIPSTQYNLILNITCFEI
jgi:hypothetical protein